MNYKKEEIQEHFNDWIKDQDLDWITQNVDDLHHHAFNTDYYIIGYYQAEQWLKEHDISIFEGIEFVQDYERDNFGNDGIRNYTNAEQLVNMITYIIGYDVVNELKEELVS